MSQSQMSQSYNCKGNALTTGMFKFSMQFMMLKASPFNSRGFEEPAEYKDTYYNCTLKACPNIMLGDAFSVD